MYDVIIVGAGPAGITAAIYLRRAKKTVAIIEKDAIGGNMSKAPYIENYPGFNGSGFQLAEEMFNPIEQDIDFIFGEVVSITKLKNGLRVNTEAAVFESKYLIWATGSEHLKLKVPGENLDHIHYCVTCDGPLYAEKDVTVIGDGNSAMQYAIALSEYVKHVSLLTLTNNLFGEEKWKDAIRQLEEEQKLSIVPFWFTNSFEQDENRILVKGRLTLGNEKEKKEFSMPTDGVFVAIGQRSNNAILKDFKEIQLDDKDFIITQPCGRTSLERFYAVGDCTSKPYKQIVLACGDGAAAALDIIKNLNLKN